MCLEIAELIFLSNSVIIQVAMFSYNKKAERLVRDLISRITADDNENSDSVSKLEKQIKSTLKHHRFLDVNSHEIKRTIEGLETKLRVHNKIPEADLLQDLFDKFIHFGFEENSALSDFNFSCVSFLHLCAYQPTENDFTPELKGVQKENDDEDIKLWTEWLISNRKANGFIEDNMDDHENDSELSDWDLEADSDNPEDNRIEPRSGLRLDRNFKNQHQNEPIVVEASDDEHEQKTDIDENSANDSSDDSQFNLKQVEYTFENLDDRNFYWRPNRGFDKALLELTLDIKNDDNSFFAKSYLALRSSNPLLRPVKSSSICLTESLIIRECIWSLLSNEINLTIFIKAQNNDEFIVNPDVFLTHLSFSSLKSTLASFMKFRNDVTICRQLCAEFEPVVSCVALTEFAQSARNEILEPFENFLLNIEQKTKDSYTTYSLLSFYQDATDWRILFGFLAEICNRIFHKLYEVSSFPEKESSNNGTATLTLFVLKQASYMLNKFLLGLSKPKCLSLQAFVNIFTSTWGASLKIVENWIKLGCLDKTRANEFFIKRNAAIEIVSAMFWKQAFVLEGETRNFLSEHDRNFFLKLADVAKAVEMITNSKIALPNGFPPDIVAAFKKETNAYFELPEITFRNKSIDDANLYLQESILDVEIKTVLRNESENLLEKICTKTSSPVYKRNIYRAKFPAYKIILKELNVANILLLSEIKTSEMNLFTRGVSALYLFQSNSSEMHDFLFELFEDLSLKRKWKDPTMLTLKLQDVFENSNSGLTEDFYENIVASLNSNESSNQPNVNQNMINQLSELKIMLNVWWPVSVVFSPDIFNTLNKVFVFLSQIKWAKYATTRLKLSSLQRYFRSQKDGGGRLKNLFYRFRFRIIHFVNVLETYFMTRVIHATHNSLNENISKVKTIALSKFHFNLNFK